MSNKPLPPTPISPSSPPSYFTLFGGSPLNTAAPYPGARSSNLLEKKNKSIPVTETGNSKNPIGWLPFELLAWIFEYAIESDPRLLGRLQCVSRAWFNVDINSQRLWARIGLVGPFRLSLIDTYIRHVSQCIQKSGNWPLHVIFEPRFQRYTPVENVKAAHQLFNHLTAFSDMTRWISCRLIFSQSKTDADLPSNLGKILGQAINLKHITLQVSQHLPDTSNWTQIATHRSLQTLELRAPTLAFEGIEFRSIRELAITWVGKGFPKHHRPSAWLASLPSLSKLKMRGDDAHPGCPMPLNKNYRAAHLTTLEIYGQPRTWNLSGAEFPALRALTVHALSIERHWFSDFEHLADIDATAVTHLTLECAKGESFWKLSAEEEGVPDGRYMDQLNIQGYFSKFLVLETLKASSCIWWEIVSTFDGIDNEIEAAARSGMCASYEFSADRLYQFMVIQDVSQFAKAG